MKLISQYKNEIIITEDKRKIEYLKTIGFTELKEEKKATNKSVKVVKNGNKEKA